MSSESIEMQALRGQQVVIRQGDEGSESASYYTGRVTGIGKDSSDKPISLILDGGAQVVPYDKDITSVSIILGKKN